MSQHKKYLVMIDYGSEGWSIHCETDQWHEAADLWKEAMGFGSRDVMIVEYLPLKITTEKVKSQLSPEQTK